MELGFGVSLSQPLTEHQETPGALSALLQSDASSCGGSTCPEISVEEHPINVWVRLVAVTAWCVQETQQGLDAPKAGSKLWTESSQLPILLGVSCLRCYHSLKAAASSRNMGWRFSWCGEGGLLKLGLPRGGEGAVPALLCGCVVVMQSPAGP